MLAIVNCRQLLTLHGPSRPRVGPEMRDLGVVENGSLLVDQGVIVASGSSVDTSQADEIIDASDCVVLPGWVDAHTHAVFAGSRCAEYELRAGGASYEEIANAGGGIRSTMKETRAATEGELFAIGLRHSQWFLANGTTTVEAKSGYGLSLQDELKILRAIRRMDEEGPLSWQPTFLGAHAFPPEFSDDRQGYVRLIVDEMIPQIAEQSLAKWCDIFVEQNYFETEQAREILAAAKSYGLGIRMHVDQLSNGGGAALAAELGAKTADHLEQTDSAGIAALHSAGVMPVLLPASVYGLGLTSYPAAREMIEAGLPVVLATDFNPGSSPTPSMPFVLSVACTHMGMTPAEAITAATINAAHSLDLSDRGTLEHGKRADFVIYDCLDYREIPYFVGAPLVRQVFIAGERVFAA